MAYGCKMADICNLYSIVSAGTLLVQASVLHSRFFRLLKTYFGTKAAANRQQSRNFGKFFFGYVLEDRKGNIIWYLSAVTKKRIRHTQGYSLV